MIWGLAMRRSRMRLYTALVDCNGKTVKIFTPQGWRTISGALPHVQESSKDDTIKKIYVTRYWPATTRPVREISKWGPCCSDQAIARLKFDIPIKTEHSRLKCILLYITSHHITPHHITSHHIDHITSHHITSHHITSHHITSHHITSHHITSHHILYYITLHYITLYYIIYTSY